MEPQRLLRALFTKAPLLSTIWKIHILNILEFGAASKTSVLISPSRIAINQLRSLAILSTYEICCAGAWQAAIDQSSCTDGAFPHVFGPAVQQAATTEIN